MNDNIYRCPHGHPCRLVERPDLGAAWVMPEADCEPCRASGERRLAFKPGGVGLEVSQ